MTSEAAIALRFQLYVKSQAGEEAGMGSSSWGLYPPPSEAAGPVSPRFFLFWSTGQAYTPW